MRLTRAALVLASLALGILLAACGPEAAGPCDADAVMVTATITADGMDPDALGVCRDQELTLELASEIDGELHVHGYDEQVPVIELTAGETTTAAFTADVAGQFIIELHVHDAGESEIGVLTVSEP